MFAVFAVFAGQNVDSALTVSHSQGEKEKEQWGHWEGKAICMIRAQMTRVDRGYQDLRGSDVSGSSLLLLFLPQRYE